MKFEISTARLLSALTMSQSVVDSRAAMPVLANALFELGGNELSVKATDMLVSIRETIDVDGQGSGACMVNCGHLLKVLKTLPGGSLAFESLDNYWVRITSGKSEFKLMGMPETDFPDLPDHAEKGREVQFASVTGGVLLDLIQKTEFSVSTDEARVNLNGVLLESDGVTATMVSTDGHRLTKYTRAMEGLVLDKGIIIPLKGMKEIRRLLERSPGEIDVGIAAGFIFFRACPMVLSVRLSNVTFPPYKQVIPKKHNRKVRLGRNDLVGALRRAEVMAVEKTASVRLRISEGNIELTADNPDKGVSRQHVAAEVDGAPLEAGFNARYMMHALAVIDTEDVILQFENELDPCVIRPTGDEDFKAVVMPMRI